MVKRKSSIDEGEIDSIVRDNVTKKLEIGKILNKTFKVKAKNDSQTELIKKIKNNEVVIASGDAGAGKTYVSLIYALNLLKNKNNNFTKIYLVKSVTSLRGEELGYLKGDFSEKIEPFMWSYFINLKKVISEADLTSLLVGKFIEPFPLAYMRGASLDNCIIIADESQNISFDNARTLLTRIGKNCKIILLGDTNQIDLKNKEDSSLKKLIEMFEFVDEIATIEMNPDDENVRNPIINVIEDQFKEYE